MLEQRANSDQQQRHMSRDQSGDLIPVLACEDASQLFWCALPNSLIHCALSSTSKRPSDLEIFGP